MLRWSTLLFVTFSATSALAGATPWQEVAPGARVRLISSGDSEAGGGTLAGIELQLPPASNTYWRIPGDSGIPTMIDLSASAGVTGPELVWPYPRVEVSGGYRDFVYRDDVVLPIRLKAGQGSVLDAVLTLGVCSDICVPAHAHLTLPLDAVPDAAQSIRLDQAISDAPAEWDQSGQPFGAVTIGRDRKSLDIAAPDPAIDPKTLIADAGDPSILLSAPQKSPDGAIWTVALSGGGDVTGLAGRPIQLIFMTARGPYVVSRTVQTVTP